MIRPVLLLATALTFTACTAPASEKASMQISQAQPTESIAKLEALSRQKWQWMAEKNIERLESLFHDQARFVHMGATMDRDQELGVIKGGMIHYKQADIGDVSVELVDNIGIVYSRIELLAVVGGNEVTNPFSVTEVYTVESGEWRLASMSFTRLLVPTQAPDSCGAEHTIRDGTTQPENLTLTSGGEIFAGSFTDARIDVFRNGSEESEVFVDIRNDGGSFLGVLADEPKNRLWACHFTPSEEGRRSSLRSFDLTTGEQLSRWDLPGFSTCNDMTVGPTGTLYLADTNGKLYHVSGNGGSGELLLDAPLMEGADGVTFLNDVLYVNNIRTGKLYKIPLGEDGAALAPVEIELSEMLNRPDGMRSANGKLYLAEAGGGRILSLTIDDADKASIEVLQRDLRQPTGVEPKGKCLWFNELQTGKIYSIPIE